MPTKRVNEYVQGTFVAHKREFSSGMGVGSLVEGWQIYTKRNRQSSARPIPWQYLGDTMKED